ncbi:ABC transporter substrate-binding protein [Sphaerisporangium siamense]|uniref:Peptide/nickel transport system substrate-binding protein n=1 Tax=Sphaerisporangium siamense TaxID=795645 RepID=A0A7W7DHI4_9ACTN|nr:ABC transporter substrate-binding protein [Sphaerisporangium siamense]MBB4705861.1 peptide/nickel transport system substrate-binding protein [Sphaerisporangium siamense]GII82745.1 ABC transporter substrate-binding protein [Sphaerisporangium siamense]
MANRRHLTIAGMAAAMLLATACQTDSGVAGPSGQATPEQAGKPTSGGTLRLVGGGDVDHLDPTSTYYTVTNGILRAYARQLFTLPATNDAKKALEIMPDVAAEIPTTANGGLSADQLTYTIKLRPGVQWDTTPPRQVTAQDFVRGFKRICNPVAGSGAPGYYTSTIKGMADYCAAYAKAFTSAKPTPQGLADFQNSREIEGVTAKDDLTIVFTLTQPASDFLNILALNFSSAAPQEYDRYAPDDARFRQNVISNGPYKITKYVATKEIRLERNPAWKQETDPVRHQYVDAIEVKESVTEPDGVQQQLEAGTADLSWDLPVPTAQLPRLTSSGDPNFKIFPGAVTNPYLVFNLQSGNENGAMGKLKVRQAIEYAISKTAINKIYGGKELNTPLHTVIPPGNIGYQEYDPYPTPGDNGDPAKCKTLLAEAGYPNGLTLTGAFRNAGNHPAVFQSYAADLKKCGITVKGSPIRQGDFYAYLQTPSNAKASKWDISAPGWIPDWYGNNGRAIIQPLFQTNCSSGTSNYGCYSNPKVDALIKQALTAPDQAAAAGLWHQVDQQVMADAVIVPFQNQNYPIYHSKRVKNALYLTAFQFYDVTNLWLDPPSP